MPVPLAAPFLGDLPLFSAWLLTLASLLYPVWESVGFLSCSWIPELWFNSVSLLLTISPGLVLALELPCHYTAAHTQVPVSCLHWTSSGFWHGSLDKNRRWVSCYNQRAVIWPSLESHLTQISNYNTGPGVANPFYQAGYLDEWATLRQTHCLKSSCRQTWHKHVLLLRDSPFTCLRLYV